MPGRAFASHPWGSWVDSPVAGWAHGYYMPHTLPRRMGLEDDTRMSVEASEWALARLSGLSGTIPDLDTLMRPAALNEAVASSRIEGTQATLRDAMTANGHTVFSDDVDDVLALYRAMTRGTEMLASLPIAGRFITESHRNILSSRRGQAKKPGHFRSEPVWIGSAGEGPESARFIPPHPTHVAALMGDWEDYVNKPPMLPLVLRLAIAHYQFETIHPFEDGNGRLGRLLIGMQIVQEGVLSWPAVTLSRAILSSRSYYYDGLQLVHETGNMDVWVRYFADALGDEVSQAHRAIQTLHQLRADLVAQASTYPGSLSRLIDVLFRRPIVSVADVVDDIRVSQPTAFRILHLAEELDWVRSLGHSGRGRKETWWAPRIWSAHSTEDPRVK